VNEFELIDLVVAELGDAATGPWVRNGPGDDAAVTAVPAGMELVSSTDALVAGVHFPARAAPELVGYRSLMVSASDLAAMGAAAGFVLVALSLEDPEPGWVASLARGMAQAARTLGIPLVGGNLARGPLNIAVSVHGYVPEGRALLRSAARAGQDVYVTGCLGAAAAALARGGLEDFRSEADLDFLARRYFLPQARIPAGVALRECATSAIDVSDGLLQDLGHIGRASGVGFALESSRVPVAEGATLDEAVRGGDDYELCFTADAEPPLLDVPVTRIGRVVAAQELTLDGRPAEGGFRHFDP
jgi:thiamine-monophosphate kinase